MSVFERKLNLSQLDQLGQSALLWLDDLFRYWAPAGSGPRSGTQHPLRFAIRKDYANFYVSGQSVAKLSLGSKGPSVLVHDKYLEADAAKRNQLGQTYSRFDTASTPSTVANWMTIAATYKGDEKDFVERLIAANPNVIDMEMALPALPDRKKSAVRMDLVALEPCDSGWKLVFWEAKMASNPDARSRDVPKVVGQCHAYRDWLGHAGQDNKKLVIDAYTAVCRDLVKIHERVTQSPLGHDSPPLGQGIRDVAEGKALLTLDDRVRLIISDDSPSFEGKGHRQRLVKDYGIFVQLVPKGDKRPILAAQP